MYVGSGGCSSDLATTVLDDPVLSRAPVDRWISLGAIVKYESADTCIVTYSDSGYTHDYTIDKTRWLIVRAEKYIMYAGYKTSAFDGLFRYADSSGTPALQSIAFGGDTAFGKGGYHFFDIRINTPLPDSLFTIGVRFRLLPAPVSFRGAQHWSGPVIEWRLSDVAGWRANLIGRTAAPRVPARGGYVLRRK